MSLKRIGIVVALLVLLVGFVAVSVGAVSAGSTDNTGSGYVFSPGYAVSSVKVIGGGVVTPMSTGDTIHQGETLWYSRYVSGNPSSVYIDLYWGNPSNSLRMRIYAPDGSIGGPFRDNFDGILNGDIPVRMSKPGGCPSGTYYIEVYGECVSGSQWFSLN